MKNLLRQFWNDEAGIVISTELVFVASITGIGMIVGLSAARDGVTSELADVGQAVNKYNQGYLVDGIRGHGASVTGSQFSDNTDYCDNAAADTAGVDEACIARVSSLGVAETTTPLDGSQVP